MLSCATKCTIRRRSSAVVLASTGPQSDDDFRNEVVRRARKYDIELVPEQVTVVRNGEGVEARMYFAADYTVPVQLPGFSFRLHFNPQSGTRPD